MLCSAECRRIGPLTAVNRTTLGVCSFIEGVHSCVLTWFAGVVSPGYQLPDHAGSLRKLSEIQGDGPLILTLAAITVRRSTSNIWNLLRSIPRLLWATLKSLRYPPMAITHVRSSARQSVPSGR